MSELLETSSEPLGEQTIVKLKVQSVLMVTPQVVTPIAADTVTANSSLLLLTPAGTLATLTIKFPPAQNGQYFTILTTAIVTALTVTNATISGGAPTALAANASYKYIFYNGTWYKN